MQRMSAAAGMLAVTWAILPASMARAAKQAPVYEATRAPNLPDGLKCRFSVTSPSKTKSTFLRISETRDRLASAIVRTRDPAMYGKVIHLVIDGQNAFEIGTGGEIEHRGYAGGVKFMPEASGRAIMDGIRQAAPKATSVEFVADGTRVSLPVRGLEAALQAYDRCRLPNI